MKKLALLMVTVGAALLFGGAAAADPTTILLTEATDTLSGTTAVATVVDPTLTDTAVTDSELSTAGVLADTASLVTDPPLLVVDDDKAQCPNAQFTTGDGIQQAIAVAPPGARIEVCPGLYHAITVAKPLTLYAPRQEGTATECMTTGDDPTKNAIIAGDNIVATVQILVSDVVVDGFTVEDNTQGAGIYTVGTGSGYQIRHSVVQRNVFGVYFNTNGAEPSSVDHNCIRGNTNPGAASSNGVYSDQGLVNAAISNNYFTGHHNAAVVVTTFIGTPHNVQIVHNESVDDSSIAVFLSDDVTVSYNSVVNSDGSAIFIGGGVTNSTISYNNLSNGTGNGVSLRNDIGVTTLPNAANVVKSNKAVAFALSGIRLGSGSINNTVVTNRVTNNTVNGIRATDEASGNHIDQNTALRNNIDCYDDTGPGPGSGGSNNFWQNDVGFTENRPELCKQAG